MADTDLSVLFDVNVCRRDVTNYIALRSLVLDHNP